MRSPGPVEWLGVAARAPAALLPAGMLLAAAGTGSPMTAALMTSFALIGLALSVPIAGAAADRHGQRPVLLATAGAHVILLVLVLAVLPRLQLTAAGSTPVATDAADGPSSLVLSVAVIFALGAGLTAPSASAMSRARGWHLHHHRPDLGVGLGAWMRREAAVDELLLVLAPVLAALLSGGLGPGAGLMMAALLGALAVPAYAMDPVADPLSGPGDAGRTAAGGSAEVPEGPLEPLRVPWPAVEHGQQMVAEARGMCPERPGDPTRAVQPRRAGAGPSVVGALLVSLGLGVAIGGSAISALVLSSQSHRPEALGLLLGLCAAAAMLSSRRLPRRLRALDVLRRRRLFALLLLLTAGLLTALLAVGPAEGGSWVGALLRASAAVGLYLMLGASAGVLLVEVYRVVARRAPTAELVSTLSSVAGSLLIGLVVGLITAGLLAEAGAGVFSSVVVIAGAAAPALVALRGGQRLRGGMRRHAGPRPDGSQGSASSTASL